jgi:hypothetical protein
MSIPRGFTILLSLFIIFMGLGLGSCNSRKAVCDSNKQYQPSKMKKNKSNYGVRYGYKSKSVRKDYVIRNGR